ncbi:GNAT family N-acetyltransferase [Herbiconiux sp. SYSU D00978]|uniref:GNAT family N-acetyltransferase n=1 Tax=Herbiconiux sp. SYSU D00978 TaxID=2812562 RepID=UPI001A9660E7|nr:GNAT family N-acetyltransferase [Herbiconiux sp. SYSU D00978]
MGVANGTITVVPANEASWDDLQLVFGERGDPPRCQCQWFRLRGREFRAMPVEERAARHREQTNCGDPAATTTSGLVAYLDGEPVGWCAVAPRTEYAHLSTSRTVWSGRDEDRTDDSVWALTCFVTRAGFRRLGVSYALAAAAVDFARDRGAAVLEGYPMITSPDTTVAWGELFVGSRSVFEAAGFTEVSRPSERRVVMRREL